MPASIVMNENLETAARSYAEDGYCVVRGMFDADETAHYAREFDAVLETIAPKDSFNARWPGEASGLYNERDSVVLHTANVQFYSAEWLKLLLDSRFLDATEALIGPDIVLHHTKLFQKPAERGAAFPPHQDWDYFPTVKNSMMAAIVHLSDATDEMGCLRIFPGSHKLGRLASKWGGNQEFARRFPMADSVPVEARAGDVVFFHCCTMHCSLPNRSSKIRKTVLVQMHAGDDEVEPGRNDHSNNRFVLRGRSHVMTPAKAGR